MAELVGRGAASDEFLDRWRVPGEADSHVWEERFGEELYVPLAREAFAAALKDAGLVEGDIDHAIVTGLHVRAVRAAASGLGVREGVLAPDLTASVGNLGAAQAGVALCDVLERAAPGQVVGAAVAGRRRRRARSCGPPTRWAPPSGPGPGPACPRSPSRWPPGATTCRTRRS